MEKLIKYPNGLTVAYKFIPTVRSIAIGVFAKVGSVNEDAKTNGLSHFIEHMTFKGTKNRTAFDIVAESDNIGANMNAFTSKTQTCYYMVCVDSDIEKCADILSDMYFNSIFPEDEIEREKGVVLEEISMSMDTPDDLCAELGTMEFYKGHPLARPILGSRKNVQSFTRDAILDFVKTHYTANNTIISVAGNISLEKLQEIIEKYFLTNFANLKCKQKKIQQTSGQLSSVKKVKKIEQSHIAFYFPGVSYTHQYASALKVFNTAFGYGMSSRLFQNIREKLGLAYSVYSYPSFYKENGNLLIYIGTNSASVEKATVAVRKEILKVMETGLTEEEFKRSKAQMRSSLVFGQESTSGVMTTLGRHASLTDEYCDFDKLLKDIDAVSLEDINKVVKQIFDFNCVTASYVGPKCDADLLKLIRG